MDCTLRIQCKNSNTVFLIDSEASHSVVPLTFADRSGFQKTSKVPCLLAADMSAINMIGVRHTELHFSNLPPLRWNFIVAEVSIPILGADLLRKWNISINFHGSPLICRLEDKGVLDIRLSVVNRLTNKSTRLADLLKRYKGLFAETLVDQAPIPDSM